ncbi:proteasome core particle subunit alpha 6 [Ascoidea rubescens DSM 1968]|uniref:Putative proteasome subunit alpha n=1 Tax=Ascoidea rubescens DSM 1968 TaxID=1344418 RepID=A0A1D2VD47_9ASCO|nr:putative proteasome subunit alpha [Ascoidea rubescens DSM 1968]ODV59519.1 putative proteasome subunit alpha [Ascoidea rubescens DSM 1968]
MFRNNYDSDTVTFSPTGRLFQVEYALEAIKQGSASIGLRSDTHAVLVALKRNAEDLGSYHKKIIKIDNHIAIALSGLAPDARVLSNYLRNKAMEEKLVYNRPIPIQLAVNLLADKAQQNTQSYGSRPYGVGLLVVGYDGSGPHLFEFQPSGQVLEFYANAIGARSQGARTYLERNFSSFKSTTERELIAKGVEALRQTLKDTELTSSNTSIAIVGKSGLKIFENEDVEPFLKQETALDLAGIDENSNSTDIEERNPVEQTQVNDTNVETMDTD